ncbi:cell surface protein [Aggregicoccus sp. 17bor-14]|nr:MULTISPECIES: cell surface protein [Myxococcaceae]MBF5046274.1 cell surface protein [Simulacricoccus sp. 17bor-14]MRI91996.1 cell surface protein [Aggregicoccus sp. 17bor-14]
MLLPLTLALALAAGCGGSDGGGEPQDDAGTPPPEENLNPCLGPASVTHAADPFADRIVSFTPGAGAGFGQDLCPSVVLGSPEGTGTANGSLHVLSLGNGGSIVLEFTDTVAVNGPGVDFIVFENAFARAGGGTFAEPGRVAVSEDGVTWSERSCAVSDEAGGYPGCAGVKPVFASSTNGVSATDPDAAGGDAFDLDDFPSPPARVRFVRITDSGVNSYLAPSGGFDLDAVAVVNGAPLTGPAP